MNKMILYKILIIILLLTSCSKEHKYPSINFVGGKDFISYDTKLKLDDDFKIGINAYTNSDYNLYKFKLTRVFDNKPEIIVDSIIDNKIYNAIFTLPTSEYAGKERWLFTITSMDGYTSEISVHIAVGDSIYMEEKNSKIENYEIDDLPNGFLDYIYYFIVIIFIVIIFFIIIKNKSIFLKFKNKNKDVIILSDVSHKKNNNIYVIIALIFLLAFIFKLIYDNLFLF